MEKSRSFSGLHHSYKLSSFQVTVLAVSIDTKMLNKNLNLEALYLSVVFSFLQVPQPEAKDEK